jgi:hypothetical protein
MEWLHYSCPAHRAQESAPREGNSGTGREVYQSLSNCKNTSVSGLHRKPWSIQVDRFPEPPTRSEPFLQRPCQPSPGAIYEFNRSASYQPRRDALQATVGASAYISAQTKCVPNRFVPIFLTTNHLTTNHPYPSPQERLRRQAASLLDQCAATDEAISAAVLRVGRASLFSMHLRTSAWLHRPRRKAEQSHPRLASSRPG